MHWRTRIRTHSSLLPPATAARDPIRFRRRRADTTTSRLPRSHTTAERTTSPAHLAAAVQTIIKTLFARWRTGGKWSISQRRARIFPVLTMAAKQAEIGLNWAARQTV